MKKYDKILNVLAKFAGIFALICYGLYFIKIIVFPEGLLSYIACFIVLIGIIIPFVFNDKIRNILGKAYLPVKTVYAGALCFYMISFIVMCMLIILPAASEIPVSDLPQETVFVTFGSKVKSDSTPGVPLARRLSKTAELMEQLPDSVCIVTGGRGNDEPVAEAEVMQKWLVSQGIDKDRIIVEDQAKNTVENIEYSLEILKESGLENRTVACVSTDYHILRIRFLSERYDFADYYYSSPSVGIWDYVSLVREYMSYCKLILLGHL